MQKISYPAARPTLTPCGLAFSTLLTVLPGYYEAERDVEGIDPHDLACDAWIAAAESARREVITAIDAVIAVPARVESDLHLQRVARLFSTALRTEDPVVYARIYGSMRDLPWLYRVDGHDQSAQRAAYQLRAFRDHLLSLMNLSEFHPEFAIVDAECIDISEKFETTLAAI